MTQPYLRTSGACGRPGAPTPAPLTSSKWYGLAVLLALFGSFGAQAQQRPGAPLFREDAAAQAAAAPSVLRAALLHSRPLTLDVPALTAALALAPAETQPSATPLVLALPLPDGSSARFAVVEASVMEPGLAAQFPAVNTYRGTGLDDPAATVRLDLTPLGFHAQILTPGKSPVYIDPLSLTDTRHYLSFYRHDMNRAALGSRPACGVTEDPAMVPPRAAGPLQRTATPQAIGATLRTYRLAVAATGEYTATKGGTVALAQAAIVTTVNRVVGVYETELAVRMVLVNNNSSLVYTNAATDPYDPSDQVSLLNDNQVNVDAVIGNANYDIGHVFTTTGGGLAYVGVVCRTSFVQSGQHIGKAGGETGLPNPSGDAFAIDYVAHEMGHQFGGNHTFNSGGTTNCSDDATTGTRNANTAYEPGSGSTIMSYAGICSPDNLQNNADPYFHVVSFEEIQTYIASTSCAAAAATGNTPPVLGALPATEVLPMNTPFKLTASATDANSDALTYCWEEYDLGPAGAPIAPQVANQTNPLFRSFLPSSNPTRYFPRLSDLVANTTSVGERLPTVSRALNFRVTVRDQHNGSQGVVGGIRSGGTVALSATSAAGPFVVTAPNTAVSWAGGSTQTVTWNVAGTTANGVNCATVNILLSTDGGFTYPTTILAGTANNGSQSITVPNMATTTARVMVEAADNYFFDISNTNFTITAGATCNAPTGVTVSSVTSSSATVNFTASASATSYTVTTNPASTSQTVSGTTANLTGLTAGTTYTVSVVSNCAGGATSSAATASFMTGPAPVVSSVSSTNGTYGIGQSLPVVVTFSQAVTVTGSPTLALTIGSTTRQASYNAAGSAGSTVAFAYVVQAGDLDTNGIGIGAIGLNGGTIRNAAGTDANLTLNNVASTSAVLVDGVRPTVTSSNRQTPATAATNASSVTFRVTFSEGVTGVTASDFTLTTTGTASGTVASVSGSGTTYDVAVTGVSGDGTLRLDLNASGTGIADAAGNAISTGFTGGQAYTVDHTAPNTTIDSGPPATTSSTSATFTFSGTDGTGSGVASFEGRLDAAAFATVTSPTTYNGLSVGSHTFEVRAIDAVGNADATPASYTWTVTAAPTCDAPTALTPGSVTSTSASVSFMASGTATSYTVTTTPATTTQTITSSPATFSNLTPGTMYTVSIVSNCAGGATSAAATTSFTTSAPPCNAPTGLAVSNITQTSASVSFVSSGAGNTYAVSTSPASTAQMVNGSPVSLSGLTAGTMYTVSIVSNCNGGTTTSPAASASFTTSSAAPTCAAPTNLAAGNVTATSATVSFTASGTATSYTVTTSPATTTQTITGSPATLVGLQPNTAYTASIVSNCTGGATSSAATASFTTTGLPNLVVNTGTLASPTGIAAGAYHDITVTGTGFGMLSGPVTATGSVTVQAGGSLSDGCQTLAGTGSFTLAAGASLYVCSALGISNNGTTGSILLTGGTPSFSTGASYVYDGTLAQTTGSGLPTTVLNFSSTNASAVTLSQSLAVTRLLSLGAGDLMLGAFSLTLPSTAAGTAMVVNGGAGRVMNNGSGTAIVQRYIAPTTAYTGPGYRHYSTPVGNTPVADLAVTGVFTPFVNPAYNALPTPNLAAAQFPNVFSYDQSRLTATYPGFDIGWRSPASTGEALAVTKGYTVNIAPAALVDLRGQLNSGSLGTGALGRVPQADGGYHLLGNPYPSPLDWSVVTSTAGAIPTGLADAIYVFEPSSQYGGFYRAFVNGVGTGGFTGMLAAMQGFFVRTSQAVPGGFTFQNTYRPSTYTNPAFHRAAGSARPELHLTLAATATPTLADETLLYLEAGASATGTDARHDAAKMTNPVAPVSLATQMSGPANEPLAISGLPLIAPAGPATRVPLLVSAAAPGSYRLRAASLTGFAAGQSVLLLDHATNTSTDLRQQPDYFFTLAQAGAATGRFEVLLGRPAGPTGTAAAAGLEFSVWPNPATGHAALHVQLAEPADAATATLRDVLGRAVATRHFSGRTADISTTGLATGTYLLTLSVSGQAPATRRVVVE